MKFQTLGTMVLTLGMAPLIAHANLELAQKNACLACHAVANKIVGPAYADVAKKYKGQKDAEATLISNIKKGGTGKWGAIPMPPQTNLSDADTKALAKWILTLSK
jgi:cytochrome c